ncbi:hypothetical protein TBLA_0H00610 [Henningerozyma blattae CBS 6284]|uniref:Glucosidase 2 subunit beta n=1 Tax=Henningerozyma blattae (strain ATCC 34711 / CBS 6284 / DSM 70876 / NBRC 10599 / NRRL Y-10934 / UCD 77-7) TaxID=1071380 RepID=I2H7K0_HENB6|nr:hypothetical protein TBLA_0H00610 [Tetrapisispora blattae CBS 6284]CCH62352.1 hypothetical protein TBLA_0H00610 [Tetrapisispora blattae CBS 6284]
MKTTNLLGTGLPLLLVNTIRAQIDSQVPESKVIGVFPEDQHLYVELNEHGKWNCLGDQSIEILPSQINDGICDCPDGSDEPGTGSCTENSSLFYCENIGFIPRYISNDKVGDGVCDCCDCSDELLSSSHVSYTGSTCDELNEIYNSISSKENANYKSGINKLKKLLDDNNVISPLIELNTSQSTINQLLMDIPSHERNLELLDKKIIEQRQNYQDILKKSNPIFYNYENNKNFNISLIKEDLIKYFNELAKFDQSYKNLFEILDELSHSYSKSLNDKVVNENVFKFIKITRSNKDFQDLIVDPINDKELLSQMLDYYNLEIPQMINSPDTLEKAHDAKYLKGKANFVPILIDSKFKYTSKVLPYLTKFRNIMEDIKDNYNVNFQDSGVIEAVDSYKKYLDLYPMEQFNKEIELSNDFKDQLENCKQFLYKVIPQILNEGIINENENMQSSFDSNGQIIYHLYYTVKNKINWLFNKFNSGLTKSNDKFQLEKLSKEITANELEIKEIENQINEKRIQLDRLREIESELLNNDADQLVLIELNQLMSKENLPNNNCITSIVDNYKYEICFNPQSGAIKQIENKLHGNTVNIGYFSKLYIQDSMERKEKFVNYLRLKYATTNDNGNDFIHHLINESKIIGEQDYLFGSLDSLNNGLTITYQSGDKCWNGPQRSAQVIFTCSDEFQLKSVQETTKCHYVFDVTGPFGCKIDV